MWRAAALALVSLGCWGAGASDPLRDSHLAAIHEQRIQWMKTRAAAPLPGIYRDFRGVEVSGEITPRTLETARSAGVDVLLSADAAPGIREGILIARGSVAKSDMPAMDVPLKRIRSAFKQFPEEVFGLTGGSVPGSHLELRFRSFTTHLLARERDSASIGEALVAKRRYAAADWLCDPAGFFFVAENGLGIYDIADRVPLTPRSALLVRLPVAAKISILRDGVVAAETEAREFRYPVEQPGDYRLRASLTIDGETWPWIETEPIHFEKLPLPAVPAGAVSPEVDVRAAPNLDLYFRKGRTNFPMLVFLRAGDGSLDARFANRFALAGIGVAIVKSAQAEETAAAFAWVYQHAAEFGGDARRIYLGGFSAGAGVASRVALDPGYLAKYGLATHAIRGVVALSGIYRGLADQVRGGTPRFLLTYCQWDAFDLPRQARDFETALRAHFADARSIFIPAKSHVSEFLDTIAPDDPTARAILDFIRP